MKPGILLLAAALVTNSVGAGTLYGTVRAEGRNVGAAGTSGKYDSREFKFVERVNYEEMRDFVVYLEGKIEGADPSPEKSGPSTTQRVVQRGAVFSPHVMPIMAGTTVEWPNEDDIMHNVFSFSEAKPFDLGLYKAPQSRQVTFDKPGRVDVFCSIHTRMNCIILVLENPYFAAADDKGRYRIEHIPPGTYKVRAWHERLPPLIREITIPDKEDVEADFILGIKNLPKL